MMRRRVVQVTVSPSRTWPLVARCRRNRCARNRRPGSMIDSDRARTFRAIQSSISAEALAVFAIGAVTPASPACGWGGLTPALSR